MMSGSRTQTESENEKLFYLDRARAVTPDQPPCCRYLYCDCCHSRVHDEVAAKTHLSNHRHATVSAYQMNTSVAPEELPSSAALVEADVVVNEMRLLDADLIFVCRACQKVANLSNQPLSILAHIDDRHSTRSCNGVCLAYRKTENVSDRLSFASTRLAKCASSNRYPCLSCDHTFSTVTHAAGHMIECKHSPLPRTPAPGHTVLDVIRLAKCLSCDASDVFFVSNTTLLFHLVKYHGQLPPTQESEPSEHSSTVDIVFYSYSYLESRNLPNFLSAELKNTLFAEQREKYSRWLKRKQPHHRSEGTANCKNASCPSSSLAYHPKASHYQQYCCDLCHVPLGLDKPVVLRHISTFKHPSVSLYNTRVESSSDVTLLSVHSYSVFRDPACEFSLVICKCTELGCGFISSDPFINGVHQSVVHRTKPEDIKVAYYSLHTTASYSLTTDREGGVTCPTCNQRYQSKRELAGHMAGVKHQTITEPSNTLLDVGLCGVCPTRNQQGMFVKEAALLDHVIKHSSQKHTAVQYTVSRHRDTTVLVPYDSEWLGGQVTSQTLRWLIGHPSSSKVMRKKYRAALGVLESNTTRSSSGTSALVTTAT